MKTLISAPTIANSSWFESLSRRAALLLFTVLAVCSPATLRAQVSTVNSFQGSGYAISNIVVANGKLWYLSYLSSESSSSGYFLNEVTPNGGNSTVTAISLQVTYSAPTGGLALGPDGNLWFPANGSGGYVLFAFNTSGSQVTRAPFPQTTGLQPSGIVTGSDGNLWIADSGSPRVWRYILSGGSSGFTSFPLSSPSYGITSGPDGNIWLTEYSINGVQQIYTWTGKVAKVTVAGVATEYALTPASVNLGSIAQESVLDTFTTGPDGALWFTEYDGTQVGRVTTAGAVSSPYASSAFGITTGPDNAIWLTQPTVNTLDNQTTGPALLRIPLTGNSSSYALNDQTFYNPFAITVGPDGALWFNDNFYSVLGQALLNVAITTSSLSAGTVGVPYSTPNLTAEGGAPPYTWSVPASQLPPGVSLSSGGVFSGTPTTVGTYPLTITVTDSSVPALTATANLSISIAVGSPQNLVPTSGGGQTEPINTAFAPLVATVTDSGNNPVPGVNVVFTAPSNGASGTFTGGVTSITVTTNQAGVASAAFTANSIVGSYSVAATVGNLTASFGLANTNGPAASITATAGTPQSAPINTAFTSPLSATVKDAGGNPVPNATVTFTAPSAGASGTFPGPALTATVTSNSSGVATSPQFTANATAGPYTVSASVTGAPAPAAFALTNTAAGPAAIAATSGTPQSATINTSFAAALVATVTDAGNNPVSGVTVTFSAPGSGASGTFTGAGASATAVTNTSGIATSPVFTANSIAGTYTVNASVSGVNNPATFALTNNPGIPASIAVVSGNGQIAQINTVFANPLVAVVKDVGGNPVPNVTVTFTAPGAGASGTFGGRTSATTTTNSSGVATSPTVTANSLVGSYNVIASAGSIPNGALFPLNNTPGAPASIAVSSGSGQSAQINNPFSLPLVVVVKDAGGNLVPNASVTFTAPASAASANFSGNGSTTVSTNNQGQATAVATANSTAGSYNVSATVSGVSAAATFALTNTPGSPASIIATSGSGQSVAINTPFAALVATVKDSGGNLVPNATVTFTAPASGPSGSFPGGALTAIASTNSSGVATSPTFTANASAGSYTVSAAVTGVSGQASFNLTNTAGNPATITASSGNGQFAKVGTPFVSPLVVLVKDAGGNPVQNVTVTFNLPGSGASATFAGGGTSATATTNSAGNASSPTLTANTTAGQFAASASVNGLTANFTLNNTAGSPGNITATNGSGQFARINTIFVNPLVVTVTDSNNNPVANATVTFTAPSSGASVTFGGAGTNITTITETTNANGVATTPTVTANSIAGAVPITASVANTVSPATFTLNNTAGPAASITASSGSGQTARINSAFNNPFVVVVKDSGGNAVSNVTVTYTAPGSGASGNFSGGGATATVQTNSTGVATSPVFNANGTVGGPYTVTATVPGVTAAASFALNNVAGITITSTTPPNGVIGQQYSYVLVAAAGTAPYAWSLTGSGGLPQGLNLSGAGVISGTPTTVGTYNFSVKVVDSSNPAQTTTQALSIVVTQPPPVITTTTLMNGQAGVAYSATLTAKNGTTPYTWSLSSGTLPSGFTLSASGTISGTTVTAGTYTFSVTVTDSSTPPLTATPQSLTLTILPGSGTTNPSITLKGIPTTQAPGTNVTGATVELSGAASAAIGGTLTLGFTPNSAVASLPAGYTGDAAFVSASGTKTTSETISIPGGATTAALPTIDPGTVAGVVAVNLAVAGQPTAQASITVDTAAPVIEANSVQITNATSSGFDVEFVATSVTREATNATFTFTPATGATLNGTTTFTVDVSSLLSSWFTSSTSYQYGGAFTITIPFTLSGSSSAIQSVSVTLTNSVGTSAPVSGTY